MNLAYYFMNTKSGRKLMSNFQIKGMDDELYAELKKLASGEGRSLSQQAVFLFKDYLAGRRRKQDMRTPAQVLLDLAGSWEEKTPARTIVSRIKKARANSKRLRLGACGSAEWVALAYVFLASEDAS